NENGIEDPSALYDVAALLLHNNLIYIESLYPYLSPSDSKICEQYQNDLNEAKNFPKKISAILAVEGAKHEDINIFEDVRSQNIDGNQKLGFILALLKLGDWHNAQKLIQMLPENFAISYPDIGDALSRLIHYLIGPLYKRMSTLPTVLSTRIPLPDGNFSFEPIADMNEFRTKIMPMIFTFGPYLYRDPLLMTKLLRVIRSALQINFDDFRYEVINVLNVTILPSFSLIESNSALGEELWSLMRLFPYNERFLLYNIWKVEPTNPLLMKMKCFTMRRIKYIMKRISKDKDSIKQSGRSIGKLSHSNPTFLFEYMLGQIQSYDNLIGPVVDSLKYLSSVSYDVLLFCVIEALSNPSREHSKHEGTSISPWLLSLANFCGSVIKKYQIELPGLLQFVANQLKLGKCLDLLILKEIVQKMTGIETSEEMTNEQLEAMS
ncbi:THO complex subunit 2-like protein, partial [Euroglyphus maynei]